MPVRIYDIAKKLGIENKVVLIRARALGIAAARVASSSLDKITAEYLEEQCRIPWSAEQWVEAAGKELESARSAGSDILNLAGWGLSSLPQKLGEFHGLKNLKLSGNQFGVFPEIILGLGSLEVLDLSRNGLEFVPPGISKLRNLQSLHLSQNRLTLLPENIGDLSRLYDLSVAGNNLRRLPASLARLGQLVTLDLRGNPALEIPPELTGTFPSTGPDGKSTPGGEPGPATEILKFYFRTRRGKRPLNEAKLILVGRGSVGKTCLIKRLVHGTFNENELETPGIEIQPWEAMLSDEERVRIHVWDFGGQEILHSTHQFFLTERTLYLLVLSGREGKPTEDAEYWLQLIRSFGGDSKVIIALNKCVLHPFDVNRGFLLEKYPCIVDFVRTDCKDSVGLSELKKLVLHEVEVMEHRKTAFPADWFDIKERLASMEENYLTWDRYREVCSSIGEGNSDAQRDLADFLHILGIALNYRDDPRLKDTHVLNPRWITEGIYPLLRAGQQQNCRGVLEEKDLSAVLDHKRYPRDKHDFLLRLMEKFKLCFTLPESAHRPKQWLVPELLGDNQPDIKSILETPGLGFRYQYEVLPEGLLPKFIVQTHHHSEQNPQWRWRTGVVLQREGCTAVVRADVRERRVDIHIIGTEHRRRELLAIIRSAFEEQHQELKGLRVEERVPVPGATGVTVSYQHLLELEEDGDEEFKPEGTRQRVQVRDLLAGVRGEKISNAAGAANSAVAEESGLPAPDEEVLSEGEKTVVELDLKGYSDTAKELEEQLSAQVGLQLNDQIQRFVDMGLSAVGVHREDIVLSDTGDGAVLVFHTPEIAHNFSVAFHQACLTHNREKSLPSARRWFRLGIATGPLAVRMRAGNRTIAGLVIARATRLEAAANVCEVLIDRPTYRGLPSHLSSLYTHAGEVSGKRDEKFLAYRYNVQNSAEKSSVAA